MLTPVARREENAGQPGAQMPPRSSIALLWMELGHPNQVHHEERTVCRELLSAQRTTGKPDKN